MADKGPGHAAIANGTVYYLYDAPHNQTQLKNELLVLQSFLTAWRANVGDNPKEAPRSGRKDPKLPSNTDAAAATKLVITATNHQSDTGSAANQARHFSVYLCTDDGWAQDPRAYGAAVHVFANNEDPSQGYKDYWMVGTKEKTMPSAAIRSALANSLATDLGTLGQGDLA